MLDASKVRVQQPGTPPKSSVRFEIIRRNEGVVMDLRRVLDQKLERESAVAVRDLALRRGRGMTFHPAPASKVRLVLPRRGRIGLL